MNLSKWLNLISWTLTTLFLFNYRLTTIIDATSNNDNTNGLQQSNDPKKLKVAEIPGDTLLYDRIAQAQKTPRTKKQKAYPPIIQQHSRSCSYVSRCHHAAWWRRLWFNSLAKKGIVSASSSLLPAAYSAYTDHDQQQPQCSLLKLEAWRSLTWWLYGRRPRNQVAPWSMQLALPTLTDFGTAKVLPEVYF